MSKSMNPNVANTAAEKVYRSQWVIRSIKVLKSRIKKGSPVSKEQLAWLKKWAVK